MRIKKIISYMLILLLVLHTPFTVYADTTTEATTEATTEDEEDDDSYWNFTEWSDEEQQEKVWNTLLFTEWGVELFEDDDLVKYTDEEGLEQQRIKTFADYLKPKEFTPTSFSPSNVDASSLRGLICEYAISAIGNKNYKMGKSSILGETDCSGFVNACYRAAFGEYYGSGANDSSKYPGFAGPSSTHGAATESYDNYCGDGFGQLSKIPKEQTSLLKPGDIVVYNINSSGSGHAGIYLGGYTDANGTKYPDGSVIHIGSSANGVHVSDMYYRDGGIRCFFTAVRLEEGTDYTTEQVYIMASAMKLAHDYFQTTLTANGYKKLGMTLYNRWTSSIHAPETTNSNLATKSAAECLESVNEMFAFDISVTAEPDDTVINYFYPQHTSSYKTEWDAIYADIGNNPAYLRYARQILGEEIANTAENKGDKYYTWLPTSVRKKIKPYQSSPPKAYKVQNNNKCGVFFTAIDPIFDNEYEAYKEANPLPSETTEQP